MEELRVRNVVQELGQILNELAREDPEAPANILFTFGEDWTLVFARGDRAEETLKGVRELYGVEL